MQDSMIIRLVHNYLYTDEETILYGKERIHVPTKSKNGCIAALSRSISAFNSFNKHEEMRIAKNCKRLCVRNMDELIALTKMCELRDFSKFELWLDLLTLSKSNETTNSYYLNYLKKKHLLSVFNAQYSFRCVVVVGISFCGTVENIRPQASNVLYGCYTIAILQVMRLILTAVENDPVNITPFKMRFNNCNFALSRPDFERQSARISMLYVYHGTQYGAETCTWRLRKETDALPDSIQIVADDSCVFTESACQIQKQNRIVDELSPRLPQLGMSFKRSLYAKPVSNSQWGFAINWAIAHGTSRQQMFLQNWRCILDNCNTQNIRFWQKHSKVISILLQSMRDFKLSSDKLMILCFVRCLTAMLYLQNVQNEVNDKLMFMFESSSTWVCVNRITTSSQQGFVRYLFENPAHVIMNLI